MHEVKDGVAMYLTHFGLSRAPFGTRPDPDFLWLGGRAASVFETLREGLRVRGGSVIVTGDVGTGKSSLIQALARLEGVAAVFVTIDDSDLSPIQFCNRLAAELGMELPLGSCADFSEALNRVLPQTFAAFNSVLIVVDEAQRLGLPTLEAAAALSRPQAPGGPPLTVALAGQLALDRLADGGEPAGPLQAAVRFRLDPFSPDDTRAYVEHRLEAAGRDAPLFTPEALSEVQRLSRGYPRLINVLCDHALLYGYGADSGQIDAATVRDCSRDLTVALDIEDTPAGPAAAPAAELPTGIPQTSKTAAKMNWRPVALFGAALMAAVVGFLLLYH
jgi:general secretion pathway protein A